MFTVPWRASPLGRLPGTSAVPGGTSSLILSATPTAPRSLYSSTWSPSRRLRRAASAGWRIHTGALHDRGGSRFPSMPCSSGSSPGGQETSRRAEVAQGGEKSKRPTPGVRGLNGVVDPVPERGQSMRGKRGGEKLELARRRRKRLPVWVGGDLYWAGHAQRRKIDPADRPGGAAEQRPDQVIGRHLRQTSDGRRPRRSENPPL